MTQSSSLEEVLYLIAEWIDSRRLTITEPVEQSTEDDSGEFPVWDSAYYYQSIPQNDEPSSLFVESTNSVDKFHKAQSALEAFIAAKVEETIKNMIQTQAEVAAPSQEHALYPKRR